MPEDKLKILIRMPNWLGDVVMATAFINAVSAQYPEAEIDLILKKGFEFLVDHFPAYHQVFIFDKQEYSGAKGAFRFGKMLRKNNYDLFFCLPTSFSSAIMAYGTKAKERIGFAKEWRNLLLTKVFDQPKNLHRVDEYVFLLEAFAGKKVNQKKVTLSINKEIIFPAEKYIIVNINSEASSRRLPMHKAVSILNSLRENIKEEIYLIGSPKEKEFVQNVYELLKDKNGIKNFAGETSMPQLLQLMSNSKLLLTTDSGPAHVANALGVCTIVLFGAGNENNTAPYNVENREIIRLGKLKCEPCLKNKCPLYDEPHCLTLLSEELICTAVKKSLLYAK